MDPKRIPVAEIMSTELLTLRGNATLRQAIAALEKHGISGAPVTNERGECVGVFSFADIAGARGKARDAYLEFDPIAKTFQLPKDAKDGASLDADKVSDRMSSDVKSVKPSTSVEAAARVMTRHGIHRVLVMEHGIVLGIVSSHDIVRLVAGFQRAEQPEAEVVFEPAPASPEHTRGL